MGAFETCGEFIGDKHPRIARLHLAKVHPELLPPEREFIHEITYYDP
jgi:hypothetical protein